jgi:glycolate oxidase FAD binding subunit
LAELGSDYEATSLDEEASIPFWRAVREVLPLAGSEDRAVWRVSVAPSRGGELGEAIARRLDTVWYLDWAGGLVWVAIAGAADGGATVIRDAIRGADARETGHATLVKGSPELRRSVPVFQPQSRPLTALAARIKEGFDPRRILNPGRMVDGI